MLPCPTPHAASARRLRVVAHRQLPRHAGTIGCGTHRLLAVLVDEGIHEPSGFDLLENGVELGVGVHGEMGRYRSGHLGPGDAKNGPWTRPAPLYLIAGGDDARPVGHRRLDRTEPPAEPYLSG